MLKVLTNQVNNDSAAFYFPEEGIVNVFVSYKPISRSGTSSVDKALHLDVDGVTGKLYGLELHNPRMSLLSPKQEWMDLPCVSSGISLKGWQNPLEAPLSVDIDPSHTECRVELRTGEPSQAVKVGDHLELIIGAQDELLWILIHSLSGEAAYREWFQHRR